MDSSECYKKNMHLEIITTAEMEQKKAHMQRLCRLFTTK